MKDGIINVYKPPGMTSNDVIYKVRAALGIKKLALLNQQKIAE